nr:trehalose-6-phosphate synthase [Sphingobacterium sp. E70]
MWVQDYQLMLLPQLLRQENQELNIGYFHHIPFPSEELFMNIPQRKELIEGLLGADLIGFHTFADSQNFLNACKKYCMYLVVTISSNTAIDIYL